MTFPIRNVLIIETRRTYSFHDCSTISLEYSGMTNRPRFDVILRGHVIRYEGKHVAGSEFTISPTSEGFRVVLDFEIAIVVGEL